VLGGIKDVSLTDFTKHQVTSNQNNQDIGCIAWKGLNCAMHSSSVFKTISYLQQYRIFNYWHTLCLSWSYTINCYRI